MVLNRADSGNRSDELKVGDKIRIIAVPGIGISGYVVHRDTVRAYNKVIARKRSVTISEIDEFGVPWYSFKLKGKNGKWEWHFLAVHKSDDNWVRVRSRRKKSKSWKH